MGLAVLVLLSSGAVSFRAEPAVQEAESSDGYSLVTQSEGVSLYASQDTFTSAIHPVAVGTVRLSAFRRTRSARRHIKRSCALCFT